MQEFHDYHISGNEQTARALLYQVFAWMSIAVGLSALAAWFAASNPQLISSSFFFILFLVQLGIVLLLNSNLFGLSYGSVKMLFIAYSLLSGLTTSIIFLIYDIASVAQIFVASAGMFASMALYGWYTRADLSSLRSILQMALIGVIIATLINMWLASGMLDIIISIIGVILFCVLTAYDIQSIRRLGLDLIAQDEVWQKVTIMCALKLYLDFLNLFLFMLNLFGRRRE